MVFFKRKRTELLDLHNLLINSFRNVQKDTSYILSWLNHLHQKNLYQEHLLRQFHSKHDLQEQLINQLHDKNTQQEKIIKQFQEELKYLPKSKEEIRKIVDEFYSYEHLLNRIKELDLRMDDLIKSHLDLRRSHSDLHQKHYEIAPKIESKLEALKSELKSEISAQKLSHSIPAPEIGRLQERLEKLETKKAAIKEKIIKKITKNSKDYLKSIILSYIRKYGKITALQLKEMIVEEQGLCSKSSFYRLLDEIEQEPDIGVIKEGKEKHYITKLSKRNY